MKFNSLDNILGFAVVGSNPEEVDVEYFSDGLGCGFVAAGKEGLDWVLFAMTLRF